MLFFELNAGSDFESFTYVVEINNIYGRMFGTGTLHGACAAVAVSFPSGSYHLDFLTNGNEKIARLETARNIRDTMYLPSMKSKIPIVDSRSKIWSRQGGEFFAVKRINIATDELFLNSLCEIGVISLFSKKGGNYFEMTNSSYKVAAKEMRKIISENQEFRELFLKLFF